MSTGAEISRRFFDQAVRPIVDSVLVDSGYLAGRLGTGSDVLGYDDPVSADHDFGCRLTVLVDGDEDGRLAELDRALTAELPDTVDGHPVRFATTWDDTKRHRVELHTVDGFVSARLGFDVGSALTSPQWLSVTGQSVLEIIAGPVFHDTTTRFERVRTLLTWYPDELWYHVLASGWKRLEQELPFVGRVGQVGDAAGSAIIAARLCRDIAHLTFLIARTWPPYPKWFGTALRGLPLAGPVVAELDRVSAAAGWEECQSALAGAIEELAELHRAAGIDLSDPVVGPFYDRPVVGIAEGVPAAIQHRIEEPHLRRRPLLGSIEQWSDSVDLLTDPAARLQVVLATWPTE